uniref:ADP/ATP translocase n=2 Tax=Lotharella globosa TaxID=91324 RepID=A0A7S3YF29_9EUKA|mmetsp:Transcript_15874/g.30018  ORF Transcript_15874/g.30018 Transcript_15874/m.30018 type:complete len:178 (+) Transcript_15874:249-782(+)
MILCYPLDFARTRLGADVGAGNRQFAGILDCLGTTVKQSGFLGVYRGISASLGGAIVYRGLQMGTFDTIMALNPHRRDKGWKGLLSGIAAAQAAGVFARPFCYPFDTVRRRLQMESEKPQAKRLYQNTLHCVRHIIYNEGPLALYKGLFADIIRGAGAAFVLVGYDRMKLMLEKDQL